MTSTRIFLERGISTRKLRDYASDPSLTIDITGLDHGRLPPVVKANIWSNADSFIEPKLMRAEGYIIAPDAKKSDLSALEMVAGTTNFQSLKKYAAPRQTKAGDININSAKTLFIPFLEISGDIIAGQIQKFNAPNLLESGALLIQSVTWFSAKKLQKPGTINAPEIARFFGPNLDVEQGQVHLVPSAIEQQLLRQSMRKSAERLTQSAGSPEAGSLVVLAPVRARPPLNGAKGAHLTAH